eukprot:1859052-Rhodomonas_salina.2
MDAVPAGREGGREEEGEREEGASAVRYLPTRVLCDVRYWHSVCCYGVSGTDIAYGATRMVLRAVRYRASVW